MIEKIVYYMTGKAFPKIIVILFTFMALSTSVVAGTKLINRPPKTVTAVEVMDSPVVEDEQSVVTDKDLKEVRPTPTAAVVNKVFPRATTVTPTIPSTLIPSAQCLVTIFGAKYDIAPLLNTHSGGNIFQCGTDMTTVYQSKHGNDVSRMKKYLMGAFPSGTKDLITGDQENEESRDEAEHYREANRKLEKEQEADDH